MSTTVSGLAGEIIAFTYPSLIKVSDNVNIPRVQGGNRNIEAVGTNEQAVEEPNALADLSDGSGNVTSLAIGQKGAGAFICGPLVLDGKGTGGNMLKVCGSTQTGGGGVCMEGNLTVSSNASDSCVNNINGNTCLTTLNVACAANVTGITTLNGGLSVADGTSTFANCATFNGGLKVASGNLLVTGTIDATNDITAFSSSDKRLKNNIIKIDNSNSVINNLNGYKYDWNEKSNKTGQDVGVIAQEVQELIPSAVRENEDGYLSVDYNKLIPYLIEEVKSLNNRIEILESK
jgi:hypothetical protein